MATEHKFTNCCLYFVEKKLLCLRSYSETLSAKSQVQPFYTYSKKQAHNIIMLTMKMTSGFVNNLNIERKIKRHY